MALNEAYFSFQRHAGSARPHPALVPKLAREDWTRAHQSVNQFLLNQFQAIMSQKRFLPRDRWTEHNRAEQRFIAREGTKTGWGNRALLIFGKRHARS